jgi:two-component system chemotaxis sensor kinase CheA
VSNDATYIELFLQEADELLGEVENDLLEIEKNPEDMECLNKLFRAMHTIKGSGSMFGFQAVADFTHHIETLLDCAREGKFRLGHEAINLVLESKDCIRGLLMHPDDPTVAAKAAKVVERAKRLLEDPAIVEPIAEPESDPLVYTIDFRPSAAFFRTGLDPVRLLNEVCALGDAEVTLLDDAIPLLDTLNVEDCYLSWKVFLMTTAEANAVEDIFIFLDAESYVAIECVFEKIDVAEPPRIGSSVESAEIPERSFSIESEKHPEDAAAEALAAGKTDFRKGTLRVGSEKLDVLMNLVGEMVIVQARLAQISETVYEARLSQTVEEMNRLSSDMRDAVLKIRMMPIGSTFNKFKRLVRDLSQQFGKQVELVTAGEETELDKTVIDQLSDPLIHMIRNCIDHGLEHPQDRIAAGKPELGTIELKAETRGANVVISVCDDGHGLNSERILEKARAQGIVRGDREMTEREIHQLIFLPGFSTAAVVTQVSGRGVGMDVVKREIEALRGKIDILSEEGKGTTIELTLPLTLAIIDGLLIQAGEEIFVIPMSTVEECLELGRKELKEVRIHRHIEQRGELIGCVFLHDFFEIDESDAPIRNVIIVNPGHERVGIIVDRVLGDHQTVIKPLGKMYTQMDLFLGSTILGDGRVALILDCAALKRTAELELTVAE